MNANQSPGGGGKDKDLHQLQREIEMTSIKSTNLAMVLVSVGLITTLGTRTEAGSPSESSPSKIVTGEVAQVEGEFHMAKDPQGELTLDIVDKSYVITSSGGEEVRLELDNNTKVRTRVQPGDKIQAKISSQGNTISVTRFEP